MSWEAWGTPPDKQEPPPRCPVCDGEWHAEDCELGQEVARRLKAEEEATKLRGQVRQLMLAEEGAAEAFGVVVQDKRDLEAEVKRLQALLDGAHATIRSMSARGGYQPMSTTGPVQPPPRKP